MSKTLRDFLKRNREAFDYKAPSPSVWHRIAGALPVNNQRTLWNSVIMWRAAAILFMGLSVYLLVSPDSQPVNKAAVREIQGEFKDVESFYAEEIEKKVKLINDFDGAFEDEFSQDFAKLDAMYQVLLDEMKISPSEKVKDALILNMLIRMDLLNQQIKKLEDSKKKKKSSSEV